MAILQFPPLDHASPEGLLAVGGDLEIPSLKLAYSQGIFPWPSEGLPLLWFAPWKRGILDFKDFKIPRRARRDLKGRDYRFAIDENFAAVIRACAIGKTRKSRGTWITLEMEKAYLHFHEAGYAHSFECYNAAGKLVGGLYGVGMGAMFAAESMFFEESGASKAVLIFMVESLKKKGATWVDIQVLSPLLKNFGAKEITREEFLARLQQALPQADLF